MNTAFFPEWTAEEIATALSRFNNRPDGISRRDIARELAPELGRTFNAVNGKLHKLTMTPEQKARWRLTENKRYRDRVPAYRSKTELEILASRPPCEVLQEHSTRCQAPVRDLTAALCGDPPVGYSALERRV